MLNFRKAIYETDINHLIIHFKLTKRYFDTKYSLY